MNVKTNIKEGVIGRAGAESGSGARPIIVSMRLLYRESGRAKRCFEDFDSLMKRLRHVPARRRFSRGVVDQRSELFQRLL
jgi:hypothetical protein